MATPIEKFTVIIIIIIIIE